MIGIVNYIYIRTGILDNAMKMIWHDNHRVAFDIGKFIFQFEIPFFNHFTGIIQIHCFINDFAEQTFAVLATNGYKIFTGLRIIIALQSD